MNAPGAGRRPFVLQRLTPAAEWNPSDLIHRAAALTRSRFPLIRNPSNLVECSFLLIQSRSARHPESHRPDRKSRRPETKRLRAGPQRIKADFESRNPAIGQVARIPSPLFWSTMMLCRYPLSGIERPRARTPISQSRYALVCRRVTRYAPVPRVLRGSSGRHDGRECTGKRMIRCGKLS